MHNKFKTITIHLKVFRIMIFKSNIGSVIFFNSNQLHIGGVDDAQVAVV